MRRRLVTLALLASGVAVVYVSASCASPAAASPAAVPASTSPRELDASEQVAQALSRLAFGARPGDAERVRAMGVDRWIDGQLHPHITFSNEKQAFGGHLEPGTEVFTFAAVTLGVLGDDVNLKRLDDKTYR